MMRKLVLLLILTLCLMLGLFGFAAPAETDVGAEPAMDDLYEDLTWSFDEETGVLSISGTGQIPDTTPYAASPWEDVLPMITAIEISEGIRSIGIEAFSEMEALKRVSLPDGFTHIGNYAFRACESLEEVNLSTVTHIGYCAFADCSSLTNVEFSSDLQTIGYGAFHGCALETVEIPESVVNLDGAFSGCTSLKTAKINCAITRLDDSMFTGCTSLTDVELPDSLQRMGAAFKGCTSLVDIQIPEAVWLIGESAFENCTSLASVELPEGVKMIEKRAFANCTGLVSVELPENVEMIGSGTFLNCSNLRKIELSSRLTNIPGEAFFGCKALQKINLPEGITWIGINAFSSSGIVRMDIPEGVETIDGFAFSDCKQLRSVSIPASTENIGKRVFSWCSALQSISVDANNPNYSSSENGALLNKAGTELLCVPAGIDVEFVIPEGVEIIREAFFTCDKLTAVDIPESVRVIGDGAFGECTRLRKLTIPASVTELGLDLLGIFWESVTEEEQLLTVEFAGNMPVFDSSTFDCAILTAYYPEGNATWSDLPDVGAEETTWIPYTPHIYGAWEVVEEPTVSEYGLKKRVCTDCGKEDTRAIAKLAAAFTDVKETSFFYTPVLWAASEGITSGMTPTTFVPNGTCTRAQVVTFLWRAMGEPEPKTTQNPFTDVNQDRYYYKAVLWAVENGITEGMSATTFAPDGPCTRGQVVTFLWRAVGSPEPNTENPFTDLNASAFYYDAVLWAVENEITQGMTPTTFVPGGTCTRGQVVTFLYRDMVQ